MPERVGEEWVLSSGEGGCGLDDRRVLEEPKVILMAGNPMLSL